MGRESVPVVQIDKYTGKVIAKYDSLSQAAKAIGCSEPTIRRNLYPAKTAGSRGSAPGQSIWITEKRFEELKAVGLLKGARR